MDLWRVEMSGFGMDDRFLPGCTGFGKPSMKALKSEGAVVTPWQTGQRLPVFSEVI